MSESRPLFGRNSLLVVATVLAIVTFRGLAAEVKVVKGVPRSQQATYTALEGKNQFKCREGGLVIPFTRVNDDYCDCADGSDEPGTSACQQGRFYCRNKGHVGAYIASSRVGDAVCDCCDGSDEAAGFCKDTCLDLAAETRAKKAEQIRMLEQGAVKKQTYIEQAKKALSERDAEYEKLKASVAEQEKALSEAEAVKEKEEKVEKEKQEAALKAQLDIVKGAVKYDSISQPELEKLFSQLNDVTGEVARELRKEVKEKGGIVDDAGAQDDEGDDGEEEGSDDESYGEEEGEEEGGDGGEHKAEGEEGAPSDKVEEAKEEVKEPLPNEVIDLLSKAEAEVKVKTDEAEAARNKVSAVKSQLSGDTARLRELERSREKDYGPDGEFWVLQGKCFTKTINQYVYEMCPYDSAKQKEGSSSTSMGRWHKLEKVNGSASTAAGYKFYFTSGQKCWNGPERSVTVTVQCGVDDEVLSVDEPSICEYTMDFATPAACDSSYSKQLKLDLEDEEEVEAVDGSSPRTDL